MQDRQGGTSAESRSIRSTGPTDRDWITQFLYDRWAADFVVVHGEVIKPADLPALTCGQGEGLATYRLLGEDAELVTLDAIRAGSGIGTALVEALAATLIGLGCKRLWLTTTNDKLSALRFYLRGGVDSSTSDSGPLTRHAGSSQASRRLGSLGSRSMTSSIFVAYWTIGRRTTAPYLRGQRQHNDL